MHNHNTTNVLNCSRRDTYRKNWKDSGERVGFSASNWQVKRRALITSKNTGRVFQFTEWRTSPLLHPDSLTHTTSIRALWHTTHPQQLAPGAWFKKKGQEQGSWEQSKVQISVHRRHHWHRDTMCSQLHCPTIWSDEHPGYESESNRA